MSFTSDTRHELARIPVERMSMAAAELSGAALACGGLSLRGFGKYGLQIQTESREILERHMAMLRRFFSIDAAVSATRTDRLGGQEYFVLSIDGADVPRAADQLKLMDEAQPFGIRQSPEASIIQSDNDKRAFLRGAFLVCGSVSNPERSYHLEFAQASETLAESICTLLRGYELPARLSRRKSQPIAYVKDAEAISTILALMGASGAVMSLENTRAMKSVLNGVNRQLNCDNSNMDKVVAASEKQISLIRTIEKRLGMDGMPDPLREIAELRLQFPDASLTDLGEMLTPRLGKSGVNARMRKLEALAEDLVNGPG